MSSRPLSLPMGGARPHELLSLSLPLRGDSGTELMNSVQTKLGDMELTQIRLECIEAKQVQRTMQRFTRLHTLKHSKTVDAEPWSPRNYMMVGSNP